MTQDFQAPPEVDDSFTDQVIDATEAHEWPPLFSSILDRETEAIPDTIPTLDDDRIAFGTSCIDRSYH